MAKLFPKSKALLSIVLVLCMLAVMLPAGLGALIVGADDVPVWAGDIDDVLTGNGTNDAPYQITSGAQLAYVAQQVNAQNTEYNKAYYELINDIDLDNQPWTPIGNGQSNNFGGVFYGLDHTIYNLKCEDSADAGVYLGLFGRTEGAAIVNLHLKDATVTNAHNNGGSEYIGGFVGWNSATNITNCSFSGTIQSTTSAWGNYHMGAIYGYGYNAVTLTNCWSDGTIQSQHTYVGGLVGRQHTGSLTITSCYSTMDLQNTSDTASRYVAGLVCTVNGTLNVTNSHFAGTINRPYPISNTTTGTIGDDVYYVDNCYTGTDGAAMSGAGATADHAKTAAEFADGTVTDLLNTPTDSTDADVWMDGPEFPVFVQELPALSELKVNDAPIEREYGVYKATVSHDAATVTVAAASAQKGSTVTVNDIDANGNVALGIPGTATEITVNVTYKALTTAYTVSVYRKPTPWDGEPAENLSLYNNQSNRYVIANGADLAYVQQNLSTLQATNPYFYVMADIDLNNQPWTPIGDSTTKFKRYVYGQGHTIYNLKCEDSATDTGSYLGLFGCTDGGAIRNLHLKDATVTNAYKNATSDYIGGFVGWNTGTEITNCSFSGTIQSTATDWGNYHMGAIYGYGYGTVPLTDCWSDGTIQSLHTNVGGLVGTQATGSLTITSCYSAMDVQNTSDTASRYVAGLVYKVSGTLKVTNSHFAGTINRPYPISTTTTGTIGADVYYVDNCYTGDGQMAGAGATADHAKTAAEFADGTATKALNNGELKWATSINGYPVLSGAAATLAAIFPVYNTVDSESNYATNIRADNKHNGIRFKFAVSDIDLTDKGLMEIGVLMAKQGDTSDAVDLRTNLNLNETYSKKQGVLYQAGNDALNTFTPNDSDKGTCKQIWATLQGFANDAAAYKKVYIARAYAKYTDTDGQVLVVYGDEIGCHENYTTSVYESAQYWSQNGYENNEFVKQVLDTCGQ